MNSAAGQQEPQDEAGNTAAEQPLFRAKNHTNSPAGDGRKDADRFLKDLTALQRMSQDDAMNRILRMLDEIEEAEAERYHTEAEQFKLNLYRHDGYTTCLRDLLGFTHLLNRAAVQYMIKAGPELE